MLLLMVAPLPVFPVQRRLCGPDLRGRARVVSASCGCGLLGVVEFEFWRDRRAIGRNGTVTRNARAVTAPIAVTGLALSIGRAASRRDLVFIGGVGVDAVPVDVRPGDLEPAR